ncbi:MAG TPA: hypothetical protein VFA99_16195 [Acidobacteriaceae bacterium]|nr:hypothetical protein [Acidobacteriaceae bacterium]
MRETQSSASIAELQHQIQSDGYLLLRGLLDPAKGPRRALSSVTIKSVVGTPTHLIRWGTNGLAFTTTNSVYGSTATGAVYLISGSIVSSSVSEPNDAPSANVQRTWSTPAVLQRQPNRAAELRPVPR